nr:MAG TPA: hypothetical protein [Caudoviricetes sp.]
MFPERVVCFIHIIFFISFVFLFSVCVKYCFSFLFS